MTDIIINQFPRDYDVYVEGFGGGASVLFAKSQNGIEVYNDINENVYALFKVLSDKAAFERLKQRMDLTPYSAQLRDEYKELLTTNLPPDDRAYYFLCVNRMSFNGVGGFSTTHIVRRNMSKSTSDFLSMIDKLPQIHNRLSSVIIEHRDIMELIDKYDRPNVFMYLDPPYVISERRSSQRYECDMTNEQHLALIGRLLDCKCKWLLSGYDNAIYQPLTDKFGKTEFKSPNSGSSAIEGLWENY